MYRYKAVLLLVWEKHEITAGSLMVGTPINLA